MEHAMVIVSPAAKECKCEGMGEVGSARYEPALLPPCPSIRILSYSSCQRSTQSHQQFKG